ncbi:MAG: hypothetical protein ORN52_07555 [Beijerinckiaceae bacterium]|nr:hypothetical protein [Beijerinckiaceae bacterium]
MNDEIDPYNLNWRIPAENEPRKILFTDFQVDYPIMGGWGYTKESPVIFSNDEAGIPDFLYRNFVSFEYSFAQQRTFEELIIFRGPENSFAGIQFSLNSQSLQHHNGRKFDYLNFKVTAMPSAIFNSLRSEYEDILKIQNEIEKNSKLEENLAAKHFFTVSVDKEFWFDITDPFSKLV